MIEAVNSVVANSSLLRGAAEQASVARSLTANPERVQEVARAPYVSPFIYVDVNYNKAVLQIRDSETGDVMKQFPSEQTMEVRARQAAVQAAQVSTPDVPDFPDVQTPTPQLPQVNAQAQVAAAALATTQAAAAAVSAPPTSGNVVVTA
jgi:hypothetical protein